MAETKTPARRAARPAPAKSTASASKPALKPAAKPASKPVVKPAGAKPKVAVAAKAAVKPKATKPAAKLAPKAPAKPQAKAAAKPAAAASGAPATKAAATSTGQTVKTRALIDQVVKATGGKKKGVKDIVAATLTQMGAALARGDELNLPGFGKVRIVKTDARDGAAVMTLKLRQISGKAANRPGQKGLAEDGDDD